MSFDGNPHFNAREEQLRPPPHPASGVSGVTFNGEPLITPDRPPFATLRDFHAHFERDLRMPDLAPFIEAVNAESRRIAQMLVTGPGPRPLRRGDEVKVTLGGYVQHINPDGTYVIAPTREPYAEPVTLDEVPRRALLFIRRDMRKPVEVGDVIDGRQVRETAWKRGTVLRDVTACSDGEGDLYVLLPSGNWRNLSYDEASPGGFEFDEFDDNDMAVVEFAPGKD